MIDVGTGTTTPVDLGDVDASWARWLDDDRLLVFGRRGLRSVALEVALASGDVRERWSTDGSVGELYHPSGSAFGDGFAVLDVVASRPPRPSSRSTSTAPNGTWPLRTTRATTSCSVRSARREPLRWTSTDGLEIEGLLTLPKGDGPFPLVLDVHGGPDRQRR